MGALAALALVAVAIGAGLWFMLAVPGRSWSGELPPLTDEDRRLRDRLQAHVHAVASREHNVWRPEELDRAARYIRDALGEMGYETRDEAFRSGAVAVRNLVAEAAGAAGGGEIVVVGAHYDSVAGAPGANDNGSGVAAVLELARAARGWTPARTWRFVLFVNEEPPFFRTAEMGSTVHARGAKSRGERIVAMYSLETIGYYSDAPGSQVYPPPFRWFYPDRGDFLAFVANPASRALLHATIGAFRAEAQFPSEGVAAPAWIPGVDWSDQWSFWREGFPAVMITDTAPYRYPHYHTPQDTPDKVDYDRLARVVRGLERTFRAVDGAL
jgi:hypothetical protein